VQEGLTKGTSLISMISMSRLFFSTFALSLFVNPLFGQKSHLLVYSQGDGAFAIFGPDQKEALKKANFIPKNTKISVRPKSGIETISAGFQFRFGAGSRFQIREDGIHLIDGSIMIRSRNIFNKANLRLPRANVEISGVGTILAQVEENGGAKFVGVLGKFGLKCLPSGKFATLLPGSLVFVKPDQLGFSDILYLDLLNLINTSYLLQGFPNSKTFSKSLESNAIAQAEMVISEVGARIGSAKKDEAFEILPIDNTKISPSPQKPGFESDPLTELLGRKPKKISLEEQSSKFTPTPVPALPNIELPPLSTEE